MAPAHGMSGNNDHEHPDIDPRFIDPAVYERLTTPHSAERPACPWTWIMSYDAIDALQNIRVFEHSVRRSSLQFPVRVFLSTWADDILVTFVPPESIREAHVLDLYATLYEVPVEEAKERLAKFPKFPYDGRNSDLARAEIIANGGIDRLLREGKQRLQALGITIPPKC